MVWTGRERPRVSSILWLSMPTSAAPRVDEQPRRGLGQEGMVRPDRRRCASGGPSRCGPAPPCRRRRGRSNASASTAIASRANDDPGQRGEPRQLERGEIRAVGDSGERARRDRCRYWRPCRSGRSGRSSRRRRRRRDARASNSRRCAARQALVGGHAVLDQVAEVDEPFLFHSVHNAPGGDQRPDHVERRRRQRAVPPAVDDEARPRRPGSSTGRPATGRSACPATPARRRAGSATAPAQPAISTSDVRRAQAAVPRARCLQHIVEDAAGPEIFELVGGVDAARGRRS